jgi:hypothetical protein
MLTPAQRVDICEAFHIGQDAHTVVARFGFDIYVVSAAARAEDARVSSLDPAVKAQILKAVMAGKPYPVIAKKHGIGLSAVRRLATARPVKSAPGISDLVQCAEFVCASVASRPADWKIPGRYKGEMDRSEIRRVKDQLLGTYADAYLGACAALAAGQLDSSDLVALSDFVTLAEDTLNSRLSRQKGAAKAYAIATRQAAESAIILAARKAAHLLEFPIQLERAL